MLPLLNPRTCSLDLTPESLDLRFLLLHESFIIGLLPLLLDSRKSQAVRFLLSLSLLSESWRLYFIFGVLCFTGDWLFVFASVGFTKGLTVEFLLVTGMKLILCGPAIDQPIRFEYIESFPMVELFIDYFFGDCVSLFFYSFIFKCRENKPCSWFARSFCLNFFDNLASFTLMVFLWIYK